MSLVVISPERDESREHAVLAGLFLAGLERYHLRKPSASVAEIEAWIEGVPPQWRSRLVLHQHHELVAKHGLGGYHWREKDVGSASSGPRIDARRERAEARPPVITSRSCHDLEALRASLGQFDSVFFGPVFASLSKPGYGPGLVGSGERRHEEIAGFLRNRTAAQRRTTILALGGIDASTASRALALGFDGVAVLGAIWQAADPIAAFRELHRQSEGRGFRSMRESGRAEVPIRPVQHANENGGPVLPTATASSDAGGFPGGQSHTVAVGTTAATS